MKKVYLAVDLGAGSGRVLAGVYEDGKLTLKELNRFPSEAVKKQDGWHWNVVALFGHIKEGIALALREYGDAVVSLGVDTWGVDYGLIDAEGKLLSDPFQYRDSRTDGMMEEAFKRMPKADIYSRTGIQFMFFNTLYQLLAEAESEARLFDRAECLLFIPDLVNYLLTGKKVNERSIASTGQLLDARSQEWDRDLLHAMGFPEKIFGELVDAGTDLGGLLPDIQKEVGATSLRVIAPGCHDTASAVAGVPAAESEPVFLSSGTWSLIGRELKAPMLTPESFAASFSNEAGVFGTTRFLKNIAGMWLLQECKRVWDGEDPEKAYGYGELVAMAELEPAFMALIDPDDESFQAPENMPRAIDAFCRRTNQMVPTHPGQYTRIILESLALKYLSVKDRLQEVTGKPVEKIYIVGGGSQNRLLNQFAADATGCVVVAGPVEATSAGNVLVQMVAAGEFQTLEEGRALLEASFNTETYVPRATEKWAVQASALLRLTAAG